MKARKDCVSDLKETDLEAMLIAQKKLLDEMISTESEQQVELPGVNISVDDDAVADKLAKFEQSEGKVGKVFLFSCFLVGI